MTRLLAPLVLALTLAATGLPASAAAEPAPAAGAGGSASVEVEVLVEGPDGRLSVESRTASTAEKARELVASLRLRPEVLAADLSAPVRAFGDPLIDQQWGLARIRATAAWYAGGAGGQTIAVIDSGVDLDHPDLSPVLTAGTDLIDGDAHPDDRNGHGTHVAGIAAAAVGNGVGIAGTAPGAKIMPVRVLDESGGGTTSAVAKGIVWAVDNGATVLNLSLGGSSSTSVLQKAVDHALSNGVSVVAAMGNEGNTTVNYPAAYSGVIAVGAVSSSEVKASFSNTGSHIDVVGPGVDILSTLVGGTYGSMAGTSMSTPFVAGTAALVQRAHPSLTPRKVHDRIRATARDLGPTGFDTSYGAGLVDAAAAVSPAVVPPYGAATSSTSTTHLVARTPSSEAIQREWTSAGLGAVTSLGGKIIGTPAVASRSTGELEVFARGSDGALWTRTRTSTGWSGWKSLGGVVTARPAAAAGPNGRVDVLVRGGDGALWHRFSPSPGRWSSWQSLGGRLLAGAGPSSVWTSPSRYDVVVVGSDARVWTRTWTSTSGLSRWSSLGGASNADVAAASDAVGSYVVVVRGTNGAAYARRVGVGATGWQHLGGSLAAGPSAVALQGSNRLDVIVAGTNGASYVKTRTTSWSGWQVL